MTYMTFMTRYDTYYSIFTPIDRIQTPETYKRRQTWAFISSREAGEPPALCMITSLATAVVEEDLPSTKTPSSHAGLWGLAKVWMADVNRLMSSISTSNADS